MSSARNRVGPPDRDSDGPLEALPGSRSVLRALEILELLAGVERALGLAETATELGIPKSSCLALLRALGARGFVKQDGEGRYVLGLRTFEVGASYLRSMTPVTAVADELRTLTERLGITAHFAVLDGDQVVYLAKHDPAGIGVRLASSLGARLPAHTTAVGKAQLAFRGPGPRTSQTREREWSQVRQRGYAVDDGSTAAGIRCVAAPVFDTGACCGAIGVSHLLPAGPDLAMVATLVVEAAGRVSLNLGGAWATDIPTGGGG